MLDLYDASLLEMIEVMQNIRLIRQECVLLVTTKFRQPYLTLWPGTLPVDPTGRYTTYAPWA